MIKFLITLFLATLIMPSAVTAKEPKSGHIDNVPANTYRFDDNDTISLPLSSNNLNRLVVRDDSITSFVCPIGFCTSSNSKADKSGSITLKINVAIPFTAHVGTKNGHNFTLFINPKSVPALVTEFIAINTHKTEPSIFDSKEFDYPMKVAMFTKQMIAHQLYKTKIAGFSLHIVDRKNLPKDRSPLAVIPMKVFRGKHYSGIIYEVTNQSKEPQTVTNAHFYSYAARSASLDREGELKPKESVLLYVVTGVR